MFRSKERLSSTLIDIVLKKGTPIGSPAFRVRYLKVPGERRIALVISKKVVKGRVSRNRERRRILHILKELLPFGYYLVVFSQHNTKDISHADLSSSLRDMVSKLN